MVAFSSAHLYPHPVGSLCSNIMMSTHTVPSPFLKRWEVHCIYRQCQDLYWGTPFGGRISLMPGYDIMHSSYRPTILCSVYRIKAAKRRLLWPEIYLFTLGIPHGLDSMFFCKARAYDVTQHTFLAMPPNLCTVRGGCIGATSQLDVMWIDW